MVAEFVVVAGNFGEGQGGALVFFVVPKIEHLDCVTEARAFDTATAERLDQILVENRPEAAELAIDVFRLLDDATEDRILFPVFVQEVPAVDRWLRLKLAVDPTVALLETGRVPGDVVMKKVEAVFLKIKSLAGRVGCQQDAHRVDRGVGVEGLFDFLAFFERGRSFVDG